MKKTIAALLMLLSFTITIATKRVAADDFIISTPFAFQERFPDGVQKFGLEEGNRLQVGCFIKPASAPVKEITVKNLDSGLVLKASSQNSGSAFSGLYLVYPMPTFDSEKHRGVWEIMAIDQKGNKTAEKTHRLDIENEMPFVQNVKATGDPLSPTISWTAPNENEVPKGVKVRYQVRLLKEGDQFYRSGGSTLTAHSVQAGVIKAEDLSDIYVRIQCQGWDENDKEHFFPLELQSSTILPLSEILQNK